MPDGSTAKIPRRMPVRKAPSIQGGRAPEQASRCRQPGAAALLRQWLADPGPEPAFTLSQLETALRKARRR